MLAVAIDDVNTRESDRIFISVLRGLYTVEFGQRLERLPVGHSVLPNQRGGMQLSLLQTTA